MQEIFLCSTCGAQNLVGQEHCQYCGQRFQYNCPYCGAIVNSTLINCPNCREVLYWPSPRRIKPFPKEPAKYYSSRSGREASDRGKSTQQENKKQQKSDPWLTGCLGVVIIAIIIMVAFFLYDWLSRPSIPEEPLPSGGIQRLLVFQPQSNHSFFD